MSSVNGVVMCLGNAEGSQLCERRCHTVAFVFQFIIINDKNYYLSKAHIKMTSVYHKKLW